MSYEEKRTWVYLLASGGAYVVYLAIVVGRVVHTPVAHVPYVAALLWTCVGSMIASTVGHTVFESASPSDSRRADVRDRDISRFGDHVSRWFVIGGAAAALHKASARWATDWIPQDSQPGYVVRGAS